MKSEAQSLFRSAVVLLCFVAPALYADEIDEIRKELAEL